MSAVPCPLEHRILMRAATARDAVMACAVLERAGVTTVTCATVEALVLEMERGVGAIVLAEEALSDPAAPALTRALAGQAPWSDLPVLVLARQGADSRAIGEAMDTAANVTVIERPMRVASFVSSVRSAMRARMRQYDLRAMLQGLREADQRKTEFLATLAHELRNPLAPLLTAVSLLARKKPPPEEATRYYDMMRRQIDHMVRLVDDLMEVSRITRGKIELDPGSVQLQSVLRDAIELSRPLLDKARHQLRVELPPEPLWLQGDAVRLTQVFSNLLNNAAKYTVGDPPGTGRVGVEARRDGDQALIEVRDNGIGIAPDMLASIFDMFVQASGTAKSAQGGLGIGLTLVKSLVELHGGSITVASPGLGQGASFTVRLPLQAAAPQAAPPVPVPVPVPVLSSAPVGADPVSDRPADDAVHALVVDDNHDAADTLAEFLRALGFWVTVAYGGQEALDQLSMDRPALAILDIGMPAMDGCELARRIRQDTAHSGMVLVALTGWGLQRDRERTADAGFDHHLVKPLDIDALMPILLALQQPV